MYKNILVTTDGSELAERGVKHAADLAKATGGKLTALIVTQPFNIFGLSEGNVRRMPEAMAQHKAQTDAMAASALARVADIAKTAGVTAETLQIEHEQPHEAIVTTAKSKGSEVIVMSSHGRSGLSSLMLGSVTQKVLVHSKVPLLVCH